MWSIYFLLLNLPEIIFKPNKSAGKEKVETNLTALQ